MSKVISRMLIFEGLHHSPKVLPNYHANICTVTKISQKHSCRISILSSVFGDARFWFCPNL